MLIQAAFPGTQRCVFVYSNLALQHTNVSKFWHRQIKYITLAQTWFLGVCPVAARH